MIDIENEVFDKIATALRSKFGEDFTVYGETVLAPSEFPCACIEETDNFSHMRTRDSGSNENHAEIVYEVNVYSNKRTAKKAECKEILSVINGVLSGLGFTRNTKNPIPLDDATKYRLFARYSAIVSRNSVIYRR